MTEEATTSEAIAEEGTADQLATESPVSTDSKETAEATESADVEIPEEVKGDLGKMPKEQAAHFEKEFKRYLTKYTQDRAGEQKQRDVELEFTKQRLAEYENNQKQVAAEIKELIKNPELYEVYRKRFASQEEPNIPDKPETLEDLWKKLEYLENKVKSTESSVEQKASMIASRKIQEVEADNRYKSAVSQIATENPYFKKYEPLIMSHMEKGGFMKEYNGSNEYSILKKATESFQAMISSEIDSAKQSLLESQKLKKASSTLQPQKTVAVKPSSGATMKDEVIAAVRARFS